MYLCQQVPTEGRPVVDKDTPGDVDDDVAIGLFNNKSFMRFL